MSKISIYDIVIAIVLAIAALTIKYVRRIAQNVIKNTVNSGLLTKKEHDVYTKVNNKLIEILIGMHCDRAYIFMFHNGTDLAGKISRKKISCIFEQVSEGTSREIEGLKELDVTAMWDWIQCFQAKPAELIAGVSVSKNNPRCSKCAFNKRVLNFNINKMETGYLKAMLSAQGIDSMLHTLIIDQTGGIMGVLGIDYCFDMDTSNFPQCDLCHEADIIALHLAELAKVKVTMLQYLKTLLEK